MNSLDPFTQNEMERRVHVELRSGEDSASAYISSKEDIFLQKLRWYRMGNEVSEKQWRDVVALILHQQGAFDEAYIAEWADKLGVTDLVKKAKNQIGL